MMYTCMNIEKALHFPTQLIYVFRINLTLNTDYFTIPNLPTGAYNVDTVFST